MPLYYGVGKLPAGSTRPTAEQSLSRGQARYHGLKKLADADISAYQAGKLIKKHRRKGIRTEKRYEALMKGLPKGLKPKKKTKKSSAIRETERIIREHKPIIPRQFLSELKKKR